MKLRQLYSDEEAQISVEMLLVLAAVLAVAVMLLTNLQSTTEESSEALSDKSDEAVDLLEDLD